MITMNELQGRASVALDKVLAAVGSFGPPYIADAGNLEQYLHYAFGRRIH